MISTILTSLLLLNVMSALAFQPYRMFHNGAFLRNSNQESAERFFLQRSGVSIPTLDETNPLRVLLCVEPTPFNYISGYANRFKEMLIYLKKAGDDVRVVTPDNDPHAPTQYNGYPITSIPGGPFPAYKLVTVSMDVKTRTIPKIIQSFKPNIVHASVPSLIGIASLFWAKRFKVPVVLSYHTDLIATMLNKADLVLCTSPQIKESLNKIGVQRVDVWRKGINTKTFSPSYANDNMRAYLTNGNPDKPLLLYVGRIGAEKRLHRLRKVLDANPGSCLAIVGHGPAEESMKQYFAGYPVVFTGKLQGEDLSRAFASSDIFVMPSDSETLGFVVMEAQASGIPVIGVAAGGLIDVIKSGSSGFLVENDENMVEFSKKVEELIHNPDLRRTFGQNACRWTQEWSWESATSILRNIQYRKALAIFSARDKRGRINDTAAQRILTEKTM